MSTYVELRDAVARTLQDSGGKTFTPDMLADIVQASMAEIGRVAPQRFQEDIDFIADALTYPLRAPGQPIELTTPFGVASTDILTATLHGLTAGTSIRFSALAGGTGLALGVVYYVINPTTDTFQLSLTKGGTAVNFTVDITQGTFARPGLGVTPEVELTRVEIWDMRTTPGTPVRMVAPADGEYLNFSDVGWKVWGGVLELPRWVPQFVKGGETSYLLRVWGYSPYTLLLDDNDVVPLSHELEQAALAYARVEGLHRLNSSRDLFTQWQTRSGNTDMSPAGLMNALNIALDDWRRKSRAIMVLREAPG